MPAPVVVCFGQRAAGDDAVALWVCEQLLREGVPARVASDATLLLELLGQGLSVVVVDAVVCACSEGQSVLQLPAAAFAKADVSPVSSHGLGIVEALAMAEVLYGVTDRVTIVAIPIARPTREIEHLSPAARAAIRPACELVHALLGSTLPHRRSGSART